MLLHELITDEHLAILQLMVAHALFVDRFRLSFVAFVVDRRVLGIFVYCM